MDEQEYTLLAADRFRYRGLSTDFEAEVAMDAERFVLDYPPGWRRRLRTGPVSACAPA